MLFSLNNIYMVYESKHTNEIYRQSTEFFHITDFLYKIHGKYHVPYFFKTPVDYLKILYMVWRLWPRIEIT